MILSYSSTAEKASTTPSIADWMSKLQEGFASTEQLSMGMIEGVSKRLEEIREKAEEKAEEENKYNSQNEEAVKVDVPSISVKSSSSAPDVKPVSTVEVRA